MEEHAGKSFVDVGMRDVFDLDRCEVDMRYLSILKELKVPCWREEELRDNK